MTDVRVRFAPSPTGMFHVGSARAALFNWAVAEQSKGRFILRIEDTDATRNRPEWTEGIISALDWIGINGSNPVFEGPYFQSAYEPQHREAVAKLLADGKAYYCDCTREQVQERTGSKDKGYDGFCRERGLSEGAVRFRTPDEGVTVVDDLVRGRVERFHLPGIAAMNLLLHEALDGGGPSSMRMDPLGKGMAQMLLDMEIEVPRSIAQTL